MNRYIPILIRFLFFGLPCIVVIPYTATEEFASAIDIFDLASTKHAVVAEGQGFFPVLNRMDDTLIAVFRAGGGHLGRGGRLVMSRSTDRGATWSAPTVIVDTPQDDRNPAVGIIPGGRIIVAYHEQGSYTIEGKYDPSLHRARCMATYSDDQGGTWTEPKPLGIPGLETCSPYGRIIQWTDGSLLMNVYGPYTDLVPRMNDVDKNMNDYAYLVRSSDAGVTWKEPSLVAKGHNETAFLPLLDNRLMAVSRSIGMARLDMILSENAGYSWSFPLRVTGPKQHPADLVRLSNGSILLLYGDRNMERKVIRGMITRDEGRTWDMQITSIFSRPVFGDFGYPSAVSLPDGRLAVMYYWAGLANDSYDGEKARAYVSLVDELEFIDAYEKKLTN